MNLLSRIPQLSASEPHQKRLAGPDILRVVACFCVIVVHVSAQGFHNFSDYWTTCVLADAAARLVIPVFFMLSGYFLLTGKRTLTLGQFLWHRLARILIPFAVILVIYLIVRQWTLSEWLDRVVSGKVSIHLWFMYSLTGLYLSVPLFEPLFASREGRRVAQYYVVLWLAAAIFFDFAKQYYGWTADPFKSFNFTYFFGNMGYFFLGALLRPVRVSGIGRAAAIALYLVATYLIFYMTVAYSFETGKPQFLFLLDNDPLVVLQSVSIFMLLKDVVFDSRVLAFVARHTYWMYLVHMLVMEAIQQQTGFDISTNTESNIFLLSAVTFAASFIASIPLYWLEQQLVRVCSHGWQQFRFRS